MPSDLLDRLTHQYDETPAARVMSATGQAGWPAGSFGRQMDEVRSILVHLTAGWPRRDSANTFVNRYTNPDSDPNFRGIGTQFYISGDGTVARLIDIPRRTSHAGFVNNWSLGVETGNLDNVAAPPSVQWLRASTDAEDIPGAKLWITSERPAQTEVLPSWWTTATYAGPSRGAVGADHMLFSEWIYRGWALLARYLLEEFRLPRNFPLLPHVQRGDVITASVSFRRIVLADERAEMMKRRFFEPPINIEQANFSEDNAGALQVEYVAAVAPPGGGLRRHNRAWRAFFDLFRGVHGHGFSGSISAQGSDHDCPGPLFDWHRLAREVWDWWWYPFDADFSTTALPRRGYRHFDANTPLLEYFYDESMLSRLLRIRESIHGGASSPSTFSLDAASPIYALANGELVAARFPSPGAGVSLAFTLVRHEVYYLPHYGNIIAAGLGLPPILPGAINYDIAPAFVYSLYMHLGRPAGMSFEQVNDNNPDWLNRVLMRKKECDLGVAFYDNDANHHGIRDAVWNNRPPGRPQRPTTLEGWRIDQLFLSAFLNELQSGEVAYVYRFPWRQPINIILGDFLGESGVIRRDAGVNTHGIRVETFSPSFTPPPFSLGFTSDWTPPSGISTPFTLAYKSEWARTPVGAEADALEAIGVDLTRLNWWDTVSFHSQLDRLIPDAAKIPRNGPVYHFHPFDFISWINKTTWEHEWPKYQVTDAAGNPITATPPRPRTRRI